MRIYERFGGISLLNWGTYFFAFGLIILAPALLTNADDDTVIDPVTGERRKVDAYTAEEADGRQVYIDQVCWHCHSQFIRPVNEENLRWGPVSQPGESSIDQPHLFGTRRIGPDLSREGGRRVDDWHYAHFLDPRFTVWESVMPAYPWLFKRYRAEAEINEWIAKLDSDNDGIVSPVFDDKTHWPEGVDRILGSPDLDTSGMLVPEVTQKKLAAWVKNEYRDGYVGKEAGDGLLTDYDARQRPTKKLENLVKYLQRLGRPLGKWRQWPYIGTPTRGYVPRMRGVQDVFVRNYPKEGGGEEPWNVTVPDGKMPLRSFAARLHGLAREKASDARRETAKDEALRYEKVMGAWRKANPEWDMRLNRGKALYETHCAGCHGAKGRGNGWAASQLRIRPRDFTRALYRYRSTQIGNLPLDGDLYRSLFRGLPGSAMPSWAHLPDEHLWLLVDYIKSFQEEKLDDEGYRDPAKPYNDTSKRLAMPPRPSMMPSQVEALAQRGRAVYAAMTCVNCHGTTGRGDGPSWSVKRANGGYIRARDFVPRDEHDRPDLRMRGGAAPEDLYRTIMTGLDGTGMPSVLSEFTRGFEAAEKLAELKQAGAPQAEIDAAAEKARVKFFVALGEDLPGVERVEKDGEEPQEYITALRPTVVESGSAKTFGDDWALVWYLMRVMDPDAVWPNMIPDEEEE